MHDPKLEGGGYATVLPIGRFAMTAGGPPLLKAPATPISAPPSNNAPPSRASAKTTPRAAASVAVKSEAADAEVTAVEAAVEDGRVCFIGTVIHETEVQQLIEVATKHYLEVNAQCPTCPFICIGCSMNTTSAAHPMHRRRRRCREHAPLSALLF
jgi:hypothetical protein